MSKAMKTRAVSDNGTDLTLTTEVISQDVETNTSIVRFRVEGKIVLNFPVRPLRRATTETEEQK